MLPTQAGRRSLLCVLDWGLGHASRSLALAARLEAAGESVHFASCGRARKFLERERPDIPVHELPAYRVTYPTRSMPLNVALQLPRWLLTIWRERRCTERLVKEQGFDRVISDNRFGCYAASIPSVFLTHQLHPITNNRLVSWMYRRYLQRFDTFWVPDFAEPERRISGQLSETEGYGHVRFIGLLSRLYVGGVTGKSGVGGVASNSENEASAGGRGVAPEGDVGGVAPDGGGRGVPPDGFAISASALATTDVPPGLEVLALLSGPEPMRSRLETILLCQLARLPGDHVLVRGLPGGAKPLAGLPTNVTVHDFADARLLEALLPAARHIVCRSGYSTLMDVYAVTSGEKLFLIPTPGQTEQRYLAEREAKRIGCRWVPDQEGLDLSVLRSD